MVDAGGDLRAVGTKPGGASWIVAVKDPRDRDASIARVEIADLAVVTSGDYERFYDEEKRFHHIVDPRSGHSPTELISVTVLAQTAFDADALSTAVFVLGRDDGLSLIESLPGVEALLVTRSGELARSSGFARYE